MQNIKRVQAMRVLEQATAIAVLFAPDQIDDFLKELGSTSIKSAIPSVHDLAKSPKLREQLKRDLG